MDDGETIRLSHTILGLNPLTIATDIGDRWVDAVGADVFVVTFVQNRLTSTKVEPVDLLLHQPVDIFDREGVGGCFEAETILADGS